MGIAFELEDSPALAAVIEVLDEMGIGHAPGLEAFETDVRDGIASLVSVMHLGEVLALRAPRDQEVNMVPAIEAELTLLETKGSMPGVFAVLRRVEQAMVANRAGRFFMLFAAEWAEDEEVRFSYGSTEDLIAMLSRPGGWCLRLLDLRNGMEMNSIQYPFVFEVLVRGPKGTEAIKPIP